MRWASLPGGTNNKPFTAHRGRVLMNPVSLAYANTPKTMATTMHQCSAFIQTGYMSKTNIAYKWGGQLKSIRMAQLCGKTPATNIAAQAKLLEKALCKAYNIVSGMLYLNRKSKKVLSIGGVRKDGIFLVLVGSKCSAQEETSLRSIHKIRRRRALMSDEAYTNQVFIRETASIWLRKPIEFGSATAAANFVTGSPSSGLIHWRNWEGISLGYLRISYR